MFKLKLKLGLCQTRVFDFALLVAPINGSLGLGLAAKSDERRSNFSVKYYCCFLTHMYLMGLGEVVFVGRVEAQLSGKGPLSYKPKCINGEIFLFFFFLFFFSFHSNIDKNIIVVMSHCITCHACRKCMSWRQTNENPHGCLMMLRGI